ncbi:MAG TPA: hypothetical protein VFV36_00240 [Candidatus Methylomirabilis sp.]|nr:hypothetical protein [Candidatus Methylomirabilis sp.]
MTHRVYLPEVVRGGHDGSTPEACVMEWISLIAGSAVLVEILGRTDDGA